MDIAEELVQVGVEIAAGRAAMAKARPLTIKASELGLSEYDIARRLGVDRMTVRNWLGKR
jgi:DNA-binding CsgD family transcriptional regulator